MRHRSTPRQRGIVRRQRRWAEATRRMLLGTAGPKSLWDRLREEIPAELETAQRNFTFDLRLQAQEDVDAFARSAEEVLKTLARTKGRKR